jgi:replicative DNA helicase
MHSHELEQEVISGILTHPDFYLEISPFISNFDFVSDLNKTIYSFIKSEHEQGNPITIPVISERIKLSGISFEDNISPYDYLRSLEMRSTPKKTALQSAKEIAKLSIRRGISSMGSKLVREMENLDASCSYSDIIASADSIYNQKINSYESSDSSVNNIFEIMESVIEGRGNNPITEFGPPGPHPVLQECYGSLLRPGNITTIVARTGVGKTQFTMDYCIKVSSSTGIPVLHLDNGEMSEEELLMRQCASLSGVPIRLLETGQWRQAGDDIVNKVRSVWKKIKSYKFYYINVGGISIDEMIQKIKQFYFAKIGRGNSMILCYDYIKTTSESMKHKAEYQVVGEMLDKLKKLIQKDLCTSNPNGQDTPHVALMTSVQSNRTGITNNRRSDSLVEDESIVSLSDRITQFTSHLFSLRQKTMDELAAEEGFGTHKLTCFKYRHLGDNVHRAIQPVRVEDGELKKNYINLNFDNFMITECGDLNDFVESTTSATLVQQNFIDEVDLI